MAFKFFVITCNHNVFHYCKTNQIKNPNPEIKTGELLPAFSALLVSCLLFLSMMTSLLLLSINFGLTTEQKQRNVRLIVNALILSDMSVAIYCFEQLN